ncbi:MAG TPA: hypothetical protein VHJ34_10420 [Actinomycetota bacterium]|nr:hypothetical protein [Actinomycetota bacterium]
MGSVAAAHTAELEQAVASLRGVRGARVELGSSGAPEVRVLVVPERDPADVAAEVVRIAAERFGVDVPAAGVKVLRSGGVDPGAVPPRRRLSSIATRRSSDEFMVRVTLELHGDVLVGEAGAPCGLRHEHRTVARAVVNGLRSLLQPSIDVDAVSLVALGDVRLAVVSLLAGADTLVGSALVRVDDNDAIARATLDALNRTMTLSP